MRVYNGGQKHLINPQRNERNVTISEVSRRDRVRVTPPLQLQNPGSGEADDTFLHNPPSIRPCLYHHGSHTAKVIIEGLPPTPFYIYLPIP